MAGIRATQVQLWCAAAFVLAALAALPVESTATAEGRVADANAPLQFAPEESVHAFYYLWYGDPKTDGRYRHWDHEVLPHWDEKLRGGYPTDKNFHPPDSIHSPYYPSLGPYSSRDPDVINHHVNELLDAGVGVIVVSWWGPAWRDGTTDTQGVSTDAVLDQVVKQLEGQQRRSDEAAMKLAFHMEPYPGRTVESVREDLEDLHRRFSASPALLRVAGRPVFYLYDSYRIPASQWARLLAPGGDLTVRGTELDGVFIGLILGQEDMEREILAGGFDGFYTYFASEAVSYASNPANWAALASWARTARKIFIPSVGPGYDDRRIRPWNAASTKDRDGGARYAVIWQAARDSQPDAVSLVSFNEWGEGTQIEPAKPWADPTSGEVWEDYGPGGPHLYMNLTGGAAGAFRRALADRQARGQQEGRARGAASSAAAAAAGGGGRLQGGGAGGAGGGAVGEGRGEDKLEEL